MTHRIAHCDFSQGEAQCECGEWVSATSEPSFDRNERLDLAWREHRREAAAGKPKPIEYEHGERVNWQLRRG